MKDVLETIIRNLVEDAKQVEITENENENDVTYQVKVGKDDMGKVIGRQGRVAKSIRTVMKALAGKEQKKVIVEFVEDENK